MTRMCCRFLLAVVTTALAFAQANAMCKGSATYRVFNLCRWSSKTHPVDYPVNAHFSPLCGTVHNKKYELYSIGGKSTPGVKEMAETGKCEILEEEIGDCVADGNCADDAFISWPCKTLTNQEKPTNGVCRHTGELVVTQKHSYVSLVSMIAPSPDWFIGISNVNLCQKNEETGELQWVDRYPVERNTHLMALDAGTDSGATFAAKDKAITQFKKISVFDKQDESNIFYHPTKETLNSLCIIRLVKQ